MILLNSNQKNALNKTNSSIINRTNELNKKHQTTSMNNSALNNHHDINNNQQAPILSDQHQLEQDKKDHELNSIKISNFNQNFLPNNQFEKNLRQNNFNMYSNNPMMNNYNNYLNSVQVNPIIQ